MTQKLYTPEQVADYLGVCTQTVRRLTHRKLLGCIYIGSLSRFTQGHIDEFLRNAAKRVPRKRNTPPLPVNLKSAWSTVGEEIREREPLLWIAVEHTELVELDRRRRVALVSQPRREWLAVLQTDKARLVLQSALHRVLGRTFKIEATGGRELQE